MNRDQLDSFFRNTCRPEERARIIKWILDPAHDQTLKAWMQNHWDFFSADENLEQPDVEKIWANLQITLKKEVRQRKKLPVLGWNWKTMAAAACVALLLTLFFLHTNRKNIQKENLIAERFNTDVENVQTTDQQVRLEDGSLVTLKPHASLHFPKRFLTDKREVYLMGEAFFEVTKNPRRPFFVYHNNVVTHVLGTSFNVRTDDGQGEVEVKVKTGRVEVYEADREMGSLNNGVVLTPNQKVTYYQDSRKFETSVTDDPRPLIENPAKNQLPENLLFNNKPLPEVIAVLQKEYGIEILLENENLNNCLFTGDLKGESLYDLLDIVCKSLSAKYQIKGTKILIKGQGCN